MAQDFKTSFIPQKTVAEEKKEKKTSGGLLSTIAVIIFILALALSAGVFAYKKILEQRLQSKSLSLERAEAAFDPDLIAELSRVDNRIESSKELLNSHVVLSPLLGFIEDSTLRNVRFEEMFFDLNEEGKIRLRLAGQASSYASIVLQAESFGRSRFLKDQLFSDFDLNQLGNVNFDFSAVIERELLNFKSNL
jgi:hypothetical protein